MLDRFHVPDDVAVRVPEQGMRAMVEDIFRKMGMPEEDAVQAADVLLYADIRGIDSHGVSNMLRVYVGEFGEGKINPTPRWHIVREAPAIATVDGDRGHGLVVGPLPCASPSSGPAAMESAPYRSTTAVTSAPPRTTPLWRWSTT